MEHLHKRFNDHVKVKVDEVISNKKEKERLLREFEIKVKNDSFLKEIPDFHTSEIKQTLFECYVSDSCLSPEDNNFVAWAGKKGYVIETNYLGEYVFSSRSGSAEA